MKRSAFIACFVAVGLAGWLSIQDARRESRANLCLNQLRSIGVYLENYVSAHGRLPLAWTRDGSGKPLHSWRLAILEMREYFDFDEHMDKSKPWTDLNNRKFFKAFDESPFCCPSAKAAKGITQYVAIVGPDTPWDPTIRIEDLREENLMVLEWPNSDIYWAEPRDITLSELKALIHSGELATEHSQALRYLDWSNTVREIPLNDATFSVVKRLVTVAPASEQDSVE